MCSVLCLTELASNKMFAMHAFRRIKEDCFINEGAFLQKRRAEGGTEGKQRCVVSCFVFFVVLFYFVFCLFFFKNLVALQGGTGEGVVYYVVVVGLQLNMVTTNTPMLCAHAPFTNRQTRRI